MRFPDRPPVHLLAPSLLVALWLALGASSAPARAQERRPSALYAQLALGVAYMNNRTVEAGGSGYNSNDHDAPGFVPQLELGVRLHPLVSLQGLEFVDIGAPEQSGLTPLYRCGLGLGATLHLHGFQLGLNAGAQLTFYMNWVDDPAYSMGANVGPFGSLSAGYAFKLGPTFRLGLHGVARFHYSTDDYMGTHYDPRGVTLGLLASIGFEGKPLLGR